MANLVIDASTTAAWRLPGEQTDYTVAVLRSLSLSTAFPPRFWDCEIQNTVQITDTVSHESVFRHVRATGLTFYDAAYLDLAIREGAQLATLDAALRKAAEAVGVRLFDLRLHSRIDPPPG